MKNRLWMGCAALAVCVCLWAALSTRAAADKEKPTAEDEPTTAKATAESDGVADVVMAYKLADWGRTMDPQSPFALVTAAEMLHRTTLFSATDAKYKDHFSGPESSLKQDSKFIEADVEKLLDEAVKMAKTNKQDVATVQAMAKAVREGRGGLNGPLTYTMEVRPGQTDTYNIKFQKGEWVRIAVRNGNEGRLYLRVINAAGDKRADDLEQNPSIAFIPHQGDGSDYKITITNKSKETIIYRLLTN